MGTGAHPSFCMTTKTLRSVFSWGTSICTCILLYLSFKSTALLDEWKLYVPKICFQNLPIFATPNFRLFSSSLLNGILCRRLPFTLVTSDIASLKSSPKPVPLILCKDKWAPSGKNKSEDLWHCHIKRRLGSRKICTGKKVRDFSQSPFQIIHFKTWNYSRHAV